MIVYAIKFKNILNCFTTDKSDLDIYKFNKISSIVKFKVKKNKNGKYFIWENAGQIVVDMNENDFNKKVKDLIGKKYKCDLEEI